MNMCQFSSAEFGTNAEVLTDVFNIPSRAELTPMAKLGAPPSRPTRVSAHALLYLTLIVLGRDEKLFCNFEIYLYLCRAGSLGAGNSLT